MRNTTSEQLVLETVSQMSGQFHVVDSNEAAAALGAELEALFSTTLRLAAEHARANANFGQAIADLYRALR
jgi:hypothetical protein